MFYSIFHFIACPQRGFSPRRLVGLSRARRDAFGRRRFLIFLIFFFYKVYTLDIMIIFRSCAHRGNGRRAADPGDSERRRPVQRGRVFCSEPGRRVNSHFYKSKVYRQTYVFVNSIEFLGLRRASSSRCILWSKREWNKYVFFYLIKSNDFFFR